MDWAGLMRAGLHGLGLAPDVFWRLTPAELAVMLGQSTVQGPMERGQLVALMADYPDAPEQAGTEGRE